MRGLRKIIVLLAAAAIGSSLAYAGAGGDVTINKSGNVVTAAGELRGTWDGQEFDLYTESTSISLKFAWPADSKFKVKVLGVAGSELGDFDLAEGDTIDLTGGGKFRVIVYSASGGGSWKAEYTDDGGAVKPAKETEIKKAGKTVTLSGSLRGTWDGNDVELYTDNGEISLAFEWPKDMELWVKVFGVAGSELGEFNLAEGSTIDLTGGGKFKLVVYSKGGAGDWTATYEE